MDWKGQKRPALSPEQRRNQAILGGVVGALSGILIVPIVNARGWIVGLLMAVALGLLVVLVAAILKRLTGWPDIDFRWERKRIDGDRTDQAE